MDPSENQVDESLWIEATAFLSREVRCAVYQRGSTTTMQVNGDVATSRGQIAKSHLDAAELLLDYGADLNVPGHSWSGAAFWIWLKVMWWFIDGSIVGVLLLLPAPVRRPILSRNGCANTVH